MQPYATIADIEARFRDQLALVAADEQTGLRDDMRVEKGLIDASIEIRGILAGRYSSSELSALDADSLALLKIYCIDVAFYRIALDFSRSTDNIKERYDQTVKRLEQIAAGKGALTTTMPPAGGDGSADVGEIGQNEVALQAPERVFTRERLGRI
ncbi:gp436 family protein [Gellertiella hungarica]|uniref:Phage gp36-like protein n=1 Tax=Gellertiella hungarica TaxID=1572859 RepID=A0A7W6J7K1_9HYPH|nr:phage protein Gp36 family protein [Gellertiella hungarica]MBB4066271.1 phage gp36-like protein [Gellertiella hungarica]